MAIKCLLRRFAWVSVCPFDCATDLLERLIQIMKKFNFTFAPKLVLSALASAGLIMASVVPAQAADAQVYNIRVVSPELTASNSVDHTWNADSLGWKRYYTPDFRFFMQYEPVGSTTTVSYQVTDYNHNPVVGKAISLIVNKGYSASTATLETENGKRIAPTKKAKDSAVLPGITNNEGIATWVLKQVYSAKDPVEPNPISLTRAPAEGKPKLSTQLFPIISGQSVDNADMLELHFVKKLPLQGATIRLVSPSINSSNAFDATYQALEGGQAQNYNAGFKWYKKQLDVASNTRLTYQVRDLAGEPMAKQAVKLVVNKNSSKSTAQVMVSTAGVKPVWGYGNEATITGLTDSDGNVSFDLLDLDRSSDRSAIEESSEPHGDLFTQVAATLPINGLSDKSQAFDLLNLYFVKSRDTGLKSVNGVPVTRGAPSIQLPIYTDACHEVLANSPMAHVETTGCNNLQPGSNTVTFTVIAEAGNSRSFDLDVIVAEQLFRPTVASTKGRVSVTFTGSVGQWVHISVAGSKTVDAFIVQNPQVVSVPAKKGKRLVTVVSYGRVVKRTVVVK